MLFAPELPGRLFGARRLANGPSTDGLRVGDAKLKDEEPPKRPFNVLPDSADGATGAAWSPAKRFPRLLWAGRSELEVEGVFDPAVPLSLPVG